MGSVVLFYSTGMYLEIFLDFAVDVMIMWLMCCGGCQGLEHSSCGEDAMTDYGWLELNESHELLEDKSVTHQRS
jgi:hypothetical protein